MEKAIILAAGRGSRMGVATAEKPKCFVELWGRKLIDWQVLALTAAGITDIAIVTGYKADALSDLGFVTFYNGRWSDTNMVSSLACASSWLTAGNCIVSYSDIYYDSRAVASLLSYPNDIALTFDPDWLEMWQARFVDPLSDAESFRYDENGFLTEIGKLMDSTESIQGQYMGLLRFTPNGWNEIERVRADLTQDERDKMHMTAALQRVVDAGRMRISTVPIEGTWFEIDSQSDLEIFNRYRENNQKD